MVVKLQHQTVSPFSGFESRVILDGSQTKSARGGLLVSV